MKRYRIKIRSILEALTFCIILLKVRKLKESWFVSIILLVFFAKLSIFLTCVVKRQESLIWIFLFKRIIWNRYSSNSWSMRLIKKEICYDISFLNLIDRKKVSILL
jgi:hypothetical protein